VPFPEAPVLPVDEAVWLDSVDARVSVMKKVDVEAGGGLPVVEAAAGRGVSAGGVDPAGVVTGVDVDLDGGVAAGSVAVAQRADTAEVTAGKSAPHAWLAQSWMPKEKSGLVHRQARSLAGQPRLPAWFSTFWTHVCPHAGRLAIVCPLAMWRPAARARTWRGRIGRMARMWKGGFDVPVEADIVNKRNVEREVDPGVEGRTVRKEGGGGRVLRLREKKRRRL
jgi:hypothetical protein